MPVYDIAVTFDGWARIRVNAPNREAARNKLKAPGAVFLLIDEAHAPVGTIVDRPQIAVNVEAIENCRSQSDPRHAPPPDMPLISPKERLEA